MRRMVIIVTNGFRGTLPENQKMVILNQANGLWRLWSNRKLFLRETCGKQTIAYING